MRTRAVRDGDHWVLNGTKMWISNAGESRFYTVMAVTSPDRGARGISAFVVEKTDPGVSFGEPEKKLGIKGSPTRTVILADTRIPADRMIGEEGTGFKTALATLDHTRVTIAAQALGIAQGALDYALGYVGQREQFGRPISDFQGVQFMLADMAMKLEAARQLTYHAAALSERAMAGEKVPDLTFASSAAKCLASDTAMAVTTDAVQLLGGYGYVRDFPVERMMRDAKITQIYEGTKPDPAGSLWPASSSARADCPPLPRSDCRPCGVGPTIAGPTPHGESEMNLRRDPMPQPVIVAGARTPIGKILGALSGLTAPALGGAAVRAALDRAGITGDQVDSVIIGNVVQAGVGPNPARLAAAAGGIPLTVPAITLNKLCLSGLSAIAQAAMQVATGYSQVVVAGGMESMSKAPHLIPGRGAGSGTAAGRSTTHWTRTRLSAGSTGSRWVRRRTATRRRWAASAARRRTRSRQSRTHAPPPRSRREGWRRRSCRLPAVHGRKGDLLVENDEGYGPAPPRSA